MNAHRDLAFIVLCLCGIVLTTIHMFTYHLIIGCIGKSYFTAFIATIYSKYYEWSVKDDSIYLITYAFTVKINNSRNTWLCICIDYN